ncbi:hypothetical protein [Paraflavitalea speifideaquila]|uniref:hypothetical protein n=1 Tax=Paraflavitalea speifideaquila TaxID=3076558 RepID=UPI0028E73284|nr:hypothetical protein [Paraflavitalea speifideiaquila]
MEVYEKANRLVKLNEEEIKNPVLVFDEFFDSFHLCDVRKELWDLLCSALSNNISWHETGSARSNLVFLYEQLEKLTEAAYVTHRRNKHKK